MTKSKKPWYASRTLWYAILTGVSGVLMQLINMHPEIGQLITANAIVVFILRCMTNRGIDSLS